MRSLYASLSRAMSVDLGARALGDAHASPLLGAARPHARRLAVLGVQQRHVGDVDRALALDHADRRVRAPRVRALVALDDVQALHVDAVARAVDADDLARLALVLARDHDDLVVGAQLHGQSTSGASETIFMKPPSRSSRATGPKMRVPRGLFWASMITAAFSSNAM